MLATTADELLADLKTRAAVADTDARFGTSTATVDAQLLRILDEVIRTKLSVLVARAADGRMAQVADVTLVVNQADYPIPARCWGGNVKQVSLVNSAGDEGFLEYTEWQDLDEYNEVGFWPSPKYAVFGDSIKLLPAPQDTTYTLRVRYVRRPSRLALVANCTLTTAVASGTLTGTIGTGWSSPTTIDVVRGDIHGTPLEDSVAVTYAATTITRASGTFQTTASDPLVIVAGDYACLEGKTCIPQVPEVALPYVLEEASAICMRVMGDAQGMQMHAMAARDELNTLNSALSKRVGRSAKAINRNSPLRFAGSGRRRGVFRRG